MVEIFVSMASSDGKYSSRKKELQSHITGKMRIGKNLITIQLSILSKESWLKQKLRRSTFLPLVLWKRS
jgi:hypothetical protein